MGFRVAHRPLITFARSHDDEPSNRTVSSFSLINDPDKQHATLGATIHRSDSWSVAPLSGEGVVILQHVTRSAQITEKLLSLVIQRFEPSGSLHLVQLYDALYPVITKERLHGTYYHIGTRHGDGGAGTQTEGMRSRDG
jgi:hypothetical protein